jgi:peptidyl-prolyl cis-trans isomerase SurA
MDAYVPGANLREVYLMHSSTSSAFSAAALLFAAGLHFASSLAAADQPASATIAVEEIVAKVNGEIITRGELDKRRLQIEAALREQGLTGQVLEDAANKGMADQLRDKINELLLIQKGKELNINVDADVTRYMARIQSEQKISDPDKFHAFIEEQTGETWEDFRLTIKNTLLGQRVISEEVYRNIVIPKAEIDKYYNEHKAEFHPSGDGLAT